MGMPAASFFCVALSGQHPPPLHEGAEILGGHAILRAIAKRVSRERIGTPRALGLTLSKREGTPRSEGGDDAVIGLVSAGWIELWMIEQRW